MIKVIDVTQNKTKPMLDKNLSTLSEAFTYCQYVQESCPTSDLEFLDDLDIAFFGVSQESAKTSIDFNNLAVIALIEANMTEDLDIKSLYFDYALEALKQGIKLSDNALCKAHLAVAYSLIGEFEKAMLEAYNSFFETLLYEQIFQSKSALGLVYLPHYPHRWQPICQEQLPKLLQLDDGNKQALSVMLEVICQSRLNFYHPDALRFLHLAIHFSPSSSALNLQLGISGLHNQLIESIAYLHLSRDLSPNPNNSQNIQALYLAYLDLQKLPIAEEWRHMALNVSQANLQSQEWAWANLTTNTPYTYVLFEEDLLLAIEPSFRSITTSVLIAQRDWFESELELWRDQIQSGMTVIDVGANIGVYTFSAARRVGNLGRVIAVEPFLGCVQCLEITRNVNKLDWVTVIAGAASDQDATTKLLRHSATELNVLVEAGTSVNTDIDFQSVTSFKLDNLIEKENLNRIDWLKIDAEGLEMQVLLGCERILNELRPNILYENNIDTPDQNVKAANYLISKGYELFYYQPYLKKVIPIQLNYEFIGKLNLVALPRKIDKVQKTSFSFLENDKSENIIKQKINNLYRIIMVVSGGLEEFISNTIASMESCKIDLSNVVIFAPRNVKNSFNKLQLFSSVGSILALEDITNQDSLNKNDDYYNYGSSEFGEFTIYKWKAIKCLLEEGFQNIIYTDVDIAWRRNPIDLLETIHKTYDVTLQTEGSSYFPPHFCTGFMSFANTKFSHELLASLIESHTNIIQTNPTYHDQLVFNNVIQSNPYIAKSIFPLSEILFANGLLAKLMSTSDELLEEIQSGQPNPMIFHANWTVGLESKKRMLQQTGNWFI